MDLHGAVDFTVGGAEIEGAGFRDIQGRKVGVIGLINGFIVAAGNGKHHGSAEHHCNQAFQPSIMFHTIPHSYVR